MQQLNSKNFDFVEVFVRGSDLPYHLNAQKGTALMAYLTDGNEPAKHVKLSDVTGEVVVVRTTDIQKVIPIIKTDGVEKYV